MNTLIAAVVTFVACFIALPIVLALARAFGLYATVNEGECRVYVLTSTAERQAAVEFAKAAAIRPAVVGEALPD